MVIWWTSLCEEFVGFDNILFMCSSTERRNCLKSWFICICSTVLCICSIFFYAQYIFFLNFNWSKLFLISQSLMCFENKLKLCNIYIVANLQQWEVMSCMRCQKACKNAWWAFLICNHTIRWFCVVFMPLPTYPLFFHQLKSFK